jgi:hypothetical protein
MAHSRTQTATGTETPTDPAGAAGMRAAIDPETGQLGMPTPEQQVVLEKALADVLPPAAEPVLRRQADGSLLVDLNGHGINYHVARRGPDGGLRLDCVESEAKVQRVLQSPPPVDANGWEVQ